MIEKAAITVVCAGLVAWASWVSFALSTQGQDIAFIKGTIKQVEKRLEGR